ncbi:response regulator transcription factor [Niabella hibiscisoli]|uniref:response regulator transcription factor n=1 Tax=Niabella hibiscisoli TaxID=1825928 RepID=UPI001F0D8238|nr:response regulator [Niabella hibiscisoli]MCH5719066.1 response regulator [Niabella hibiscisoli]
MKRIVVVDDDENVREIFHIAFDDSYHVSSFANGDSILNRQTETPHLFIIDRMHPGSNGLDLCRFIKTDALYNQTPVMILSARNNIVTLGKSAGADIVIEKPFCLNYLQQQVEKYTL